MVAAIDTLTHNCSKAHRNVLVLSHATFPLATSGK